MLSGKQGANVAKFEVEKFTGENADNLKRLGAAALSVWDSLTGDDQELIIKESVNFLTPSLSFPSAMEDQMNKFTDIFAGKVK